MGIPDWTSGQLTLKKHKMKTLIVVTLFCLVGLALAADPAEDCDICNHLVKLLEDYLSGGKTNDEAKKFMDGLCDKLPLFNEKCTEYADKIVDFIYNNAQPGEICSDIGFCKN